MSLKARVRLSIVAVVTVVGIARSVSYLYSFSQLAFESAAARAALVADQGEDYVLERIARETVARALHPRNIEESEQAWAEILRSDPRIAGMLKRTLGNADVVANIIITDAGGKVLSASDPGLVGTTPPPMESFERLKSANAFRNLWDLMRQQKNYSVTLPLG